MSAWKEHSLLDFAEIHNHIRVPLSKMERAERQGTYPYFGASGIIDYVDDFLFDGEFVLISEDGENLKSRQTPIAFKVAGKFWVNNHAHILKGKKDFHNNLIVYYFKNLDLNPYITGAVQPKLNKANLLSIPLLLPENENEQKAIASVLSSLDDKIDLLHRQNKTLEAMAETLFRQWFVEKAQEDWEKITIGNCCRLITKGTTPTTLKKAFVPSGINFIKVNCIDENGNFIIDKVEFIDEETNELLHRSKLEEGDILYSIAGTIGRLITVGKEILPANVNQALAILRVDSKKISPTYIKYCLKDREITENLQSKVVHAVQPNLSLGEISKTTVPFPPNKMLNNFVDKVTPIESKLRKNKIQIGTLEKLRETLLPKMMSGAVHVSYNYD